jgi:hypothetical protein
MNRRNSAGRFVRNDVVEQQVEQQEEGFLRDMQGFLAVTYRFWRFVPLLLVVLVLGKYFHVSEKIIDIFVEILCGSGCKCPNSCEKKTSF